MSNYSRNQHVPDDTGFDLRALAFDQPVALEESSGWWDSMYWRVVRSRHGKPLVLVAQKKKALAVAQASLLPPSAQAPLSSRP